MPSTQAPLSDEELTSAVELLRNLIPADDFPAYSLDVSPATVYTTLVTLWMLTLQRLGGGKSLAAVIKEVLRCHGALLPDNKRVREGTLSLGIENIRAKSDEMVQKELLCSVVAYNLVVQLRREAAKLARVAPRRLSFTGVWTTMQTYLLRQPPCTAGQWLERYERALRSAAQATLPNRPGRSYPRRAHPRRSKSTKFMQQNQKNLNTAPPES